MLVHPGQRVPGGVVQDRGVGSPGVHRSGVTVGAGVKRDRARKRREGSQARGGQRPGGAIQGRARHQGLPQVRGGVPVDLAHAERGLIGIQRGQLTGGEGRRRVGDHDPVEVPRASRRQRRQGHRLRTVRTRGVDLGVAHPLVGQPGRPGRRGRVRSPSPDPPDQQDIQVQRRRSGRSRSRTGCRHKGAHGQRRCQECSQADPCSAHTSTHRSPPNPEKSFPLPRQTASSAMSTQHRAKGAASRIQAY